jgi:hypothetical protein
MSDQLGGSINSEYTHNPGRDQEFRFHGTPLRHRCRNPRCRMKLPTLNRPASMMPPPNRPHPTGDATSSDWRPTGNGGGAPDIPDFLRRRPCA